LGITPAAVFDPLAVGSELFVVWEGDDILSPSPLDTTLEIAHVP
jgi:hypothetical protein